VDASKVPANSRKDLADISEQILQSMEAVAVTLPGQQVEVDKPWAAQQRLLFATPDKAEPAIADMKYSYLGVRSRSGRSEVVVRLAGTVRGPKGNGNNLDGRIWGTVVIDLESGHVILTEATIDVDMDVKFEEKTSKISGTRAVRFGRNEVIHYFRDIVPASS
jgi:hypothetical protein